MKDIALPSCKEIEQYCIGSIFHEKYASDRVFSTLSHLDFADPSAKFIYIHAKKFWENNKPITDLNVIQELRSNGVLEAIGGMTIFANIVLMGHGVDIDYYCSKVLEYSHRRQIINLMLATVKNAADIESDFKDLFEDVMRKLSNLYGGSTEKFKIIKEIVQNFKEEKSFLQFMLEKKEQTDQGKNVFQGTPTGFKKLDQMIGGLGNGHNIVIGARSGTGKTTFLINLIKNVCENYPKKRIAFFSLEMSKESIVEKIICTIACVDPRKYQNFTLSESEVMRLVEASKIVSEWNVLLYPYSNCNMVDFSNSIRREFRNDRIDIVFTDYLTRIKPSKKQSTKHLEIDDISKSIQDLALEMNIPLVTLAQLNRNIFNRQDKTPVVGDLRESGSIEEDADTILLLHRPKHYDEYAADNLEVHIAKNRHLGTLGKVTMSFDDGRFQEIEIDDIVKKINKSQQYY